VNLVDVICPLDGLYFGTFQSLAVSGRLKVCVLWLRGLVSAQGEIAGTPNHRKTLVLFYYIHYYPISVQKVIDLTPRYL